MYNVTVNYKNFPKSFIFEKKHQKYLVINYSGNLTELLILDFVAELWQNSGKNEEVLWQSLNQSFQ